MFERLQKPFLTVETGEAYQPIRICYLIRQKDKLVETLNHLKCCETNSSATSWNWFWKEECNDLHFESLESYRRNSEHPPRLGTLTIRDNLFYINLPSFKRACLALPFFHRLIEGMTAQADHADFINKVFGTDERLPHGFSELFKEDELEKIVQQRLQEYDKVQEQCENAKTPEEAFAILSEYANKESQKRLPYAERYEFQHDKTDIDPDVVFLGFYIFLRGRELVAIRRWFGKTDFTLGNVSDEIMEKVFGDMDIDIIE